MEDSKALNIALINLDGRGVLVAAVSDAPHSVSVQVDLQPPTLSAALLQGAWAGWVPQTPLVMHLIASVVSESPSK